MAAEPLVGIVTGLPEGLLGPRVLNERLQPRHRTALREQRQKLLPGRGTTGGKRGQESPWQRHQVQVSVLVTFVRRFCLFRSVLLFGVLSNADETGNDPNAGYLFQSP